MFARTARPGALSLIRAYQAANTSIFYCRSVSNVRSDVPDVLKMAKSQLEIAVDFDRSLPRLNGVDSNGRQFESILALWQSKVKASDAAWYKKGEKYWDSAPKNLDGVLGGQVHVDAKDISSSLRFLKYGIERHGVVAGHSLDCGAGIGRVTRQLLAPVCQKCSMVEQDAKYLQVAVDQVVSQWGKDKIGAVHVAGLQDFDWSAATASSASSSSTPRHTYDVVWLQWVVGCVLDNDFIRFLQGAASSLTPDSGCIVIKDNVCRVGQGFWYDDNDSSISRSYEYFGVLFDMAGLAVLEAEPMRDDEWDPDLMGVCTFMLRPKEWVAQEDRVDVAAMGRPKGRSAAAAALKKRGSATSTTLR